MDFTVTAKQYGNSVQFDINAIDQKEALMKAHDLANDLYDYAGFGDRPTVSIKPKS